LGSFQAGEEFWRQSILRVIRNVIHLLLSNSLAEEENADQLLNQIAGSLMSVAKTPAAIDGAE
jgi:Mn-containing catalase